MYLHVQVYVAHSTCTLKTRTGYNISTVCFGLVDCWDDDDTFFLSILYCSIGGESLAVAQNAYAVMWFKGRELNMVFGLLLSISRVVSVTSWQLKCLIPIFIEFVCIVSYECACCMLCVAYVGWFWHACDRMLYNNVFFKSLLLSLCTCNYTCTCNFACTAQCTLEWTLDT